jgi:hypothetical protein
MEPELLAGAGAGMSKFRLRLRLPALGQLKGTVARDFWPLVFFMNRPHMVPIFIP